MSLNCKAGDLAVLVRSAAGNEGKIVRCVRLATIGELQAVDFHADPTWVIDRSLESNRGHIVKLAHDDALRPITPPDGTVTTDEVTELYSPDSVPTSREQEAA